MVSRHIYSYLHDEYNIRQSDNFAFTSCKIQDYFSNKDRVSNHLKSRIVYKFICASCNACSVGETTRHLSSRIKEHLNKDKAALVFQCLQESSECKSVLDHNCFSIIDTDTEWKLKVKEGGFTYFLVKSQFEQTGETLCH